MLAGLAAAGLAPTVRAQQTAHSAERPRLAGLETLQAYFSRTAPQLLRSPGGVLRFPSVSPSLPRNAYSTQLWDWDTYWTSRGLLKVAEGARDSALRSRVLEHVRGSLLNFLDHQSDEGRIPIMIDVENADFFGSVKRDRPAHANQAKPVMAQLALLAADGDANLSWLAPHFDKLLRFHDSWTRTNLSGPGLLVWGNDVAIGDDNDPTTFGRPFFSSANLLLNCLYHQDLTAAAELADRLGRRTDGERLTASAAALAEAIRKHCWDPRDRFFYTADVQCVDRRPELIPTVKPGMAMSWSTLPLRIQMFTGFLPMWSGIATPAQAQDLIELHLRNDATFRAPAGVRTLSAQETMYSLAFSSDPSNWLGPVWIIVNYLVWKGLRNYGFHPEADELAEKTIRILADDLTANGSLDEYYHPETGKPLSHHGFMDWNLLVLEMGQGKA